MLESSARLARTAKDRQRIELEILALQYDLQRAELEAVIASRESTEVQREIARRRLAILDQLEGNAREGVIRDNQGPLGQLADGVPKTAAEMNEALEGVAAGGLSDMVDGFAEAALGARKLGDVVSDVLNQIAQDILKLALKRAILGPIASAIGGLFGGAPALSGPTIDIDAIEKMLPPIGVLSLDGARAGGGPVSSGKRYLVGEHGPEIFEPGASGAIVPNGGLKAMGGSVVHQTIQFAGGVDLADKAYVQQFADAAYRGAVAAIHNERRRAA